MIKTMWNILSLWFFWDSQIASFILQVLYSQTDYYSGLNLAGSFSAKQFEKFLNSPVVILYGLLIVLVVAKHQNDYVQFNVHHYYMCWSDLGGMCNR